MSFISQKTCHLDVNFSLQQKYYNMKAELDDGNYEGMIARLTKGSAEQKSSSLKKFIFLYQNARSRIYLYERRITECLELLLLMEQKDIATLTLNLLQKIIINTSPDSQIFSIIKKKLLSKIVLNLGSVQITTRKISHRCLLQYLRKCKDFDSIILCYIKTGIQQTENVHLKIKSINSLHSLIMAEPKLFTHGILNTQILLQEMIDASHQKQYIQIRRASILCLLQILRLDGSEKTLKIICSATQKQLYELKLENTELASLLQIIMKYKHSPSQKAIESEIESVPSPKFMTINEQQAKQQLMNDGDEEKADKISDIQMKIYNDVSYAEQFLKKLQKNQSWELNQIKQFAPYLQKYLVDESIKLFSISKKIVQVIFDSECEEQREYYVVLVPCVVNGIGNKRFIVRKNLDKLVRQYIKNHTEVWVQNFIQRFAQTQNQKIKQILIELFLHAYRTSPQFYHPTNRTFSVMEKQIKDIHSNLKWKAVDCLITVIEKQAKNEKQKQEMMSTLSPDVYNKIMRKMNKTQNSLGSNPGSVQPVSPSQKMKRKQRRQIRLTTDQPNLSIQKSNQKQIRKDNISEEKNASQIMASMQRDRRTRKSQADIDFKIRKSKQQRESIKKLPQLRRGKYSNIVSSKIEANNQSPVKKSMGQKSIMYVDKQNLPEINEPKLELEKALIMIKDSSWNTQFESINCIRSIIQNHKQLITQEYFNMIIFELLQCLNNMRSGVSKIALICLGELLRKFHKRSHPFTDQIVNTLVKKSITTSEFIQEEIKRCITISVQQLCPTKMLNSLTTLKDTAKGSEVKISILGMVDAICKNDKIYKKELEWIWNTLIYFHEEPNLQVKLQSRRVAKSLIESHKDWKNDINSLKPTTLQKIDKIIKGLLGSNNLNGQQQTDSSWLQTENKELGKLISAKVMTSRYFSAEFNKFEEQDKILTIKKNFKERSKLLSNMFSSAFQYPNQFESNNNARKYIGIALDHLDQKNPGLLLNSLASLNKCLQVFPVLMQECLPNILEKILPLLQLKKVEIGQSAAKFLLKGYEKLDKGKCCKQLFKTSVNPLINLKSRVEALNQTFLIMKGEYSQEQQEKLNCLQSFIIKVLVKLSTEAMSVQSIRDAKIRQILTLGCRRFSNQFSEKIHANQRLSEILVGNIDKPIQIGRANK